MRVLFISDPHLPFCHRDTIPFLKKVQKKYSTNYNICAGDLLDQHALAHWDTDPDGDGPGPEVAKATKDLKIWYKTFPQLDTLLGNHDQRAYRKAFSSGIPRIFLKNMAEVLNSPKRWRFLDNIAIDGIRYEHGDAAGANSTGANALRTLPISNMQSTVFGHYHSFAGIQYLANPRMLFFGMNAGCLIDKDQYAFAYGKRSKNKSIISCGVILNGLPILEPMILNNNGRWIGRL